MSDLFYGTILTNEVSHCRNCHLNRHVRIAYHRILKPELFPLLICNHKEA